MVAIIAVVLIFSIPIIDMILDHVRKQSVMKQKLLEEQLELEKIKHENYLLETEKLRLELEKMKLTNFSEVQKLEDENKLKL